MGDCTPKSNSRHEQNSELDSCDLGKKEYWDNQYQLELTNYLDHGDEGEVWFGNAVMNRVIRWCKNNKAISKDVPVLDIGSGNGVLSMELAESGFTNVLGVDYSEAAIELSKRIAKERDLDVCFEVCDILSKDGSILQNRTFGLLLDKGTYDAISLSENSKENRQMYIQNVAPLLDEDGLFVITTCNWTEEEIKWNFSSHFEAVETVPTPSFQFGGKKGSNVSIVVFKRK